MKRKIADAAAVIAMALAFGVLAFPTVFSVAFAAGMGWTFGRIVWGVV